ncbi:MAG: hypothetical protein ACK5EO_15200 [Planctomycetota bacterium]|jgi:hypothetical protein
MNIKRGVIAALTCSSIGVAFAVLLIAAFVLGNWFFNDPIPAEREFDTRWLSSAWMGPAIGVAIYLGLTGFATFAPTINYGFARTLAIISLVSIPLTLVLSNLEITPKRVKIIEHPVFYPSELAILIIPPAGVAALLLAWRLDSDSNNAISTKKTEPSDARQALDRPI